MAGTQIRTVDDLAGALKSGKVTPSQITVDYVMKDGVPIILDTLTSVALIKAGIKQEEWYGINTTGEGVSGLPGVTYDKLAEDQIQKNKLSSTGTSTPPAKN